MKKSEIKLRYALVETGVGWLGISGSAAGLRRIILPQSSTQKVISLFGESIADADRDISFFGDLPYRLISYYGGEMVAFPDSMDPAGGTSFQHAVWQMTRSIPYGQTKSYAWVAVQIGIPKGARAVGHALARNPMPIVVPCHRVIGTRGDLVGFGYGLETKHRLLQGEAASLAKYANSEIKLHPLP